MTQMDLLAWTPRYPAVPGSKAAGTSSEAAEAMKPRAGILRAKVLDCLRTRCPLTADECAEMLGDSVLAIRPRFSELRALGLVVDTGDRRINDSGRRAIVWGAA
jgi:predicted ArsR family transcriptional regulator